LLKGCNHSSISLVIFSWAILSGDLRYVPVFSAHAQSNNIQNAKKVDVIFETTLGNFIVRLDSQAAPKTVANFVNYVNPRTNSE